LSSGIKNEGSTNVVVDGNTFLVGTPLDGTWDNTCTIKNNIGYTTENSGTATIASGNTSVTVAHGLASEPSFVILTGTHSEVKDAYVSAKDSTNITITVDSAVTADRDIYWYAEV